MSIRVRLRPMARSAVAVPVVPPVCIGWQADGADFRVDDPAASLVDIWVERVGLSPRIWAEIPSIGAGETKTVYLYYGNTTVASVSDGIATFARFDDFDDYAINEVPKAARGWSTAGINANNYFKAAANPSGSGNVMKGVESGDGVYTILINDGFAVGQYEIRYKFYALDATFREGFVQAYEGATLIVWHSMADGGSGTRCKWFDGITRQQFNPVLDIVYGFWNSLKARITTVDFHLILDTIDGDGGLASVPAAGVEKWDIRVDASVAPSTYYIDDFLIRKYEEPEPTITVGDVEAGSWTLDGDIFTCRRAVEIDNSGGGARTNYQVPIEVPMISPCFGDKVVSIV